MDLSSLMRELDVRGAVVEVQDGRLRVRPPSVLTLQILEALREHKPDIIREHSIRGNSSTFTQTPAETVESVTSEAEIGVPIGRVPSWLDLDAVHAWADRTAKPIVPWCPMYRHKRGWRSVFGAHLICGTCHPPAVPAVVAEWVDDAIAPGLATSSNLHTWGQ